jgi:uncharacterized membrane protein YdfJ with MMPL/SSD domain
MKNSPIARLVILSCRFPLWVSLIALLLTAAALVFAAQHFAMTTDTAALISPSESWRQNEAAMDRAFPQNSDTTLVVVDGATPELAESGAGRLTQALAADKAHFKHVERPLLRQGGPAVQIAGGGEGHHRSTPRRPTVPGPARRRS